jgi:hypothetical protein
MASMALLVSGCATGMAHLSGWWSNAARPRGVEPTIDPIGGRVLFYWIDTSGNACHGDPGKTGRLGPVALDAYRPEALAAAQGNAVVSPAQLASFQEAPFEVSRYGAAGLHYAQFEARLWRVRGSQNGIHEGTCLKGGTAYFGVPEVIQLGGGSVSLHPIFESGCQTQSLPLPAVLPEAAEAQDPSHCQTRQRPPTSSETFAAREGLCVVLAPHGSEVMQK